MAPGSRSPGCSSSARRAAPTCGCSAPRTPRAGCGCPGTGPTWASSRCAPRYGKEGSLADQATDTASAALLKRLRFDFIDGLDGADLSEDDQRIVKECLDQAIANYVKALASLPAPAAPA